METGHSNIFSKFILLGKNTFCWEFLAYQLGIKHFFLLFGTPPQNGDCLIRQKSLSLQRCGARCPVFGLAHRGSTIGFPVLQRFSVGIAVEYSSCFMPVFNLDLYVCCFVTLRS